MQRIAFSLLAGTLCAGAAAEVTKFEITETILAYQGRSFGSVGAYTRITGKATVALDPADAGNRGIVDLAMAPRNATQRAG
jgi:hypothetical protein